jgi:beta-lactam-binding protein with PASTA domain
LKFDAARKRLQDAGFQVADQPSPVDSYLSKGAVVGTTPKDKAVPGFLITINTSNGVSPAPVYYPPSRQSAPPPPPPPSPAPDVVVPPPDPNVFSIPGLPLFFPPPPPPEAAPPPPPAPPPPGSLPPA